jgi:signal transduction histidine kinase
MSVAGELPPAVVEWVPCSSLISAATEATEKGLPRRRARHRSCNRSRERSFAARIALATDDAARLVRYVPDMLRRAIWNRDFALAAALGVLIEVELWLRDFPTGDHLALAPAGITSLTFAWRSRIPLVVLVLAVKGWVISSLLSSVSDEPPITLAAFLAFALYTLGAHTEGLRTVAGGMLVVFGAVFVLRQDTGVDPGILVFVAIPLLVGFAMKHRRARERHLEERATALEREREENARIAVAEERARIGRELHDVVAHAVSVIVLQARGGRRALADDVEQARQAFDSIESTGGEALTEMRRLLGRLRDREEQIALEPRPGLAHLGALVAQVREAGLPVELVTEGPQVELPPGVDLSAYRIVQEGLTNALKHAGPARARVVVRYDKDELELEISDDGQGAGSRVGEGGSGHGLIGIRERVAVYGGELQAGRRPEGGYLLKARLPVHAAS